MPSRFAGALDPIDAKLLSLLAVNGRMSNNDMASALELSPSATLMRRRRLEERGTIRGYTVILDPSAYAGRTETIIILQLSAATPANLRTFETLARSAPDVDELLRITGDGAYFVRISSDDVSAGPRLMEHLDQRNIDFTRSEIHSVLARLKPNVSEPPS